MHPQKVPSHPQKVPSECYFCRKRRRKTDSTFTLELASRRLLLLFSGSRRLPLGSFFLSLTVVHPQEVPVENGHVYRNRKWHETGFDLELGTNFLVATDSSRWLLCLALHLAWMQKLGVGLVSRLLNILNAGHGLPIRLLISLTGKQIGSHWFQRVCLLYGHCILHVKTNPFKPISASCAPPQEVHSWD